MSDEDQGGFIPGQGNPSYSNPMYNFAGTILEMTDNEDLFFRLESNLRGQIVGHKGGINTVGEPLMNEKGIKDVIMLMRSFGDRSSVMSFYSEADIKMLMEMLNDALARLLLLNRINYGFNNPSGRDLVVFMANACGYAIIKRGYEGGERRFWKGSQLEYNVKTGGEPKKGLFSGMFKR